MKPANAKETTTHSTPPLWKRSPIRTGALAVMIALGAATAFITVVPAARAFADGMGDNPHASFFAAMHGGHSHADMHAHFEKVLDEAGVGDAQKQQIHAIMKDAMDAEHADMASFHASLKQLKTLLAATTIDEAAIATVRAEQDRLMLATSHRMADTMIAVARVLTPEQRAKLGAEIDG
ncbi:MAG TPA: Spy/CpxP family protein refolding chaperone [Xanthomonadaceae bacterium]